MLTQCCSGDQIEKNEMCGACGTYGGRSEVYTGFCWGNLRERDQLEDPGVDGSVILSKIFRKWAVGAWTGLILLELGADGGHL
jgi:hypothetical protein